MPGRGGIATRLGYGLPQLGSHCQSDAKGCYNPMSSLRKRNDVQGKGWLDFSSLSLTNGVAGTDPEDNVSGARVCGSKG